MNLAAKIFLFCMGLGLMVGAGTFELSENFLAALMFGLTSFGLALLIGPITELTIKQLEK